MKQLPNILTVLRFVLTLIFIGCLIQPGLGPVVAAVLVFLAASISDYYDGYLAKKYKAESNFGKIMDPIADKFLLLAAFYIFMDMGIIAFWMFAVILVREILVTGMRVVLIGRGLYLGAAKAGKCKTVSQIVAVCVILIFIVLLRHPIFSRSIFAYLDVWLTGIGVLMLITVGMTLISGISYMWNNRRAFCMTGGGEPS